MKKFLIGASRGRKKDGCYEQRLEINKDGLCNTLTSVLKDNYVIEIEETEENTS